MDLEPSEGYIYDILEAVVDIVQGKKREKLKFAKCTKCGRINPFRPRSKGMQFTALHCKHCGSLISFGIHGKNPKINKLAEIFCENCEDDCRKCPINKLANEQTFSRKRYSK